MAHGILGCIDKYGGKGIGSSPYDQAFLESVGRRQAQIRECKNTGDGEVLYIIIGTYLALYILHDIALQFVVKMGIDRKGTTSDEHRRNSQ